MKLIYEAYLFLLGMAVMVAFWRCTTAHKPVQWTCIRIIAVGLCEAIAFTLNNYHYSNTMVYGLFTVLDTFFWLCYFSSIHQHYASKPLSRQTLRSIGYTIALLGSIALYLQHTAIMGAIVPQLKAVILMALALQALHTIHKANTASSYSFKNGGIIAIAWLYYALLFTARSIYYNIDPTDTHTLQAVHYTLLLVNILAYTLWAALLWFIPSTSNTNQKQAVC
jgi:hypothetical protein